MIDVAPSLDISLAKDVERTGHVQQLHPGRRQDRDGSQARFGHAPCPPRTDNVRIWPHPSIAAECCEPILSLIATRWRSAMSTVIETVRVPDTRLACEITELVRDTEPSLLFHHSSRVYYWGALAGAHRGLKFDPELLYAGAMFHDMGLTPQYRSKEQRFEVDSANAARDFLRSHGISEAD